jgi:hypothetical protein
MGNRNTGMRNMVGVRVGNMRMRNLRMGMGEMGKEGDMRKESMSRITKGTHNCSRLRSAKG